MARKIWTAAELDAMSPAEVDALFRASIVSDLDEVPSAFLDKVRADLHEHIANTDSSPQR